MSNVVAFPRHKLYRCDETCDGCFFCHGGLASCTTCGGAEASLPTHCPQVKMDSLMCACVQDGTCDFRDGEWHFKSKSNKGRLTWT